MSTLEPLAVQKVFEHLFSRARDADEFEYACALLRNRGMETAGWDPLKETQALFLDIHSLLDAPLAPYTRVRLGLLLYSHLTEVDEVYKILGNLVEVTAGERCVIDPFHDLWTPAGKPRFEQYPPSARRVVDRLKEIAGARGLEELVELLEWFFNNAVRNAFFHSDYILFEDEFRSRDGAFPRPDGTRSSSIKLDEVVELINRAIVFYTAFIEVYSTHRSSYTEDKVVRGRFGADGSEIDVTLMATEERGLYGFRTGPTE